MCLNIKFKTKKASVAARDNPLVAKKDIVVWKVLRKCERRNKLSSPLRYYEYCRGYIYYQVGEKFTFDICRERDYDYKKDRFVKGFTLSIYVGLHSYKNIPLWGDPVPCIIPKGSEYYTNDIEIVSDQLYIPSVREEKLLRKGIKIKL